MGHPYFGDNLYIIFRGEHYCRECNRAATRKLIRKKNPGAGLSNSEKTHCPWGHLSAGENL